VDSPAVMCPYVGLQSFTEDRAEYFFGREKETHLISSKLYASRLTLLYGASGVGKSSVLRAGVVRSLREEEVATVYLNAWQSDPTSVSARLWWAKLGESLRRVGKKTLLCGHPLQNGTASRRSRLVTCASSRQSVSDLS